MKVIKLDRRLLNAISLGAREDGFSFAIVPDEFDEAGAFEITRRHGADSIRNLAGDEVVASGLGDTEEEAWNSLCTS